MLFIAGISLSFFLSLLLISKRGKKLADFILAAWLVVIGIHLLLFYLHFSGVTFRQPWLLGSALPLPLVHGPFLYLYASALTNRLSKKVYALLHFLPLLFSYLYLIRFFALSDAEKIFVFQNKGVGFETYASINFYAILTSGIGYVAWTTLLLRKHRARILNEFSNTDKISLTWLQYLIYGITVIWLIVFAGNDQFIFGAVVVYVVFIGYFGIRQTQIFSGSSMPSVGQVMPMPNLENGDLPGEVSLDHTMVVDPAVEPPSGYEPASGLPPEEGGSIKMADAGTEVAPDKKKYTKSGLSTELSRRLHAELVKLMEEERLYVDSELSLSSLAARLNIHPNYLSQVINEKEGKNFYDYINSLRIEACKRLLADPANQKFTILSLAFECGFNSKSSFNRYFKKVTGRSPSEYLQEVPIRLAD